MPARFEVTATALNLRASPSASAPVLTVLKQGTTGFSSGPAVGGWQPLAAAGKSGYAASNWLRALDDAPAPATAQPVPAPAVADAPPVVAAGAAGASSIVLPTDPQTRLRGVELLHPLFRTALQQLLALLAAEDRPFRVFEAFRTPERQRWLYEQGRSRPGSIVTKALPWQSFHQYGLGADLVLFVGGQWTWSDAGPLRAHWQRLPVLARQVGLRTLTWEAPHVEWPVDLADAGGAALQAQGDEAWSDAMALAASRWRDAGLDGAPARLFAERPPLTEAPGGA